MVWLYAGGVSLISPDVRFGSVSLDYVTYLVNIPEPVQYKIYALALPFDLRCESGT